VRDVERMHLFLPPQPTMIMTMRNFSEIDP
jgi:hypothetical protein